ncbi:outer membrane protein [Methylosinus sp. Sm6]|uniref:outer membrane protein n=1 Tax=Methylosinus sp. Sm6 TaxID=2866948 RepID=UPI001C99E21B|nr:outer membrane beta-barrel protein [Methylosinus sp. Sm6]MBY6240869.1 outer membrane beta-barrel protein [Methylosinus sp. Sm6]
MTLFRSSFLSLAGVLSASLACAADLPSHKAPPIVAPPAFSWQGGYIGLYAGALLGEGRFHFLGQAPLRGSGFVGGGTLGYNWQYTPEVVLGVEADFGFRGQIAAETVSGIYPGPTDSGVLGTLRGRAGYAFTPGWLLYATGGFAYGTDFVPRTFSANSYGISGQDSTGGTVRAGWTVGGGFEHQLFDRVSVKGEYLYVWLVGSSPSYTSNIGTVSGGVSSAGHVVRAGLNYRFGGAN